MTNFNFSLADLRALSVLMVKKTVSRIKPLYDIKIFGFLFEIYAEIFGSDFLYLCKI